MLGSLHKCLEEQLGKKFHDLHVIKVKHFISTMHHLSGIWFLCTSQATDYLTYEDREPTTLYMN